MADAQNRQPPQGANQFKPPAVNGAGATPTDPSRTMSASPAAAPGSTPNGTAPNGIKRRRPKANPLVAKQRPPIRKRPRPDPKAAGANGANGGSATAAAAEPDELSDPIYQTTPTAFPIYASKKSLIEGVRFHAMRLQSKEPLDLYDESQFTHPIRLHRRDPRADPNGAGASNLAEETPENPEDIKEREKMELMKEQRRKQREENQAQIAPSSKPSKQNAFQKKTEQVFRSRDDPASIKRAAIRYQEAIPWHLEDFESKHIWVGSYEAALSECHIMLIERDGGFEVVPVSNWYRFSSKIRGKTWTAEEADQAYAVKLKPAEYQLQRQALDMQREAKLREQHQGKMFLGKREDAGFGRMGGAAYSERVEMAEDANDLDYEEDFADDEEGTAANGLFEGEPDDIKQSQARIKQEQLAANAFDMKDEQEVWKQEEEERRRREEERKLERRTNKQLRKLEKNFLYGDDSDDDNPYGSSSSSSEDEEEAQQTEESKKQEEQAKGKEPEKSSQQASATSTKGTNTPSANQKSEGKKLVTSLGKRPGSPGLSEASGNESSRKKTKKKHTTQPGSTGSASRPMSPELAGSAGSGALRKMGAGSDSEGTDGGRAKKLKLRVGSPAGSPGGSRAGSPAAPGASPGATSGARVQASSPGGSPPSSAGAANLPLPTKEEVLAVIPKDVGIEMKELLRTFKHRVNKNTHKDFIQLVRDVARMDNVTKRIMRK